MHLEDTVGILSGVAINQVTLVRQESESVRGLTKMEQLEKTCTPVSKRQRYLFAQRRYNNSAKGEVRNLRYEEKHLCRFCKSSEYQRERYHKLQEEAGFHIIDVSRFVPGLRLLQALETAEVVEI